MTKSRKKQDQEKLDAYLKRLELAMNATAVDAFETPADKRNRIQRARLDVKYMVETYLPHYAEAECAAFQTEFAGMVAGDPCFIGFAEWGRGLAKSVWCGIIIPLWLWMRGEDVFFCLMSNSEKRAVELLSDIQAELEGNRLLINDFGSQKCEGEWAIGNFKTADRRFIGMAFGIKIKVRGVRVGKRRPNLWTVDDLETPDTIANPKRMRRQAEIIERDVIPTMTSRENRRLM